MRNTDSDTLSNINNINDNINDSNDNINDSNVDNNVISDDDSQEGFPSDYFIKYKTPEIDIEQSQQLFYRSLCEFSKYVVMNVISLRCEMYGVPYVQQLQDKEDILVFITAYFNSVTKTCINEWNEEHTFKFEQSQLHNILFSGVGINYHLIDALQFALDTSLFLFIELDLSAPLLHELDVSAVGITWINENKPPPAVDSYLKVVSVRVDKLITKHKSRAEQYTCCNEEHHIDTEDVFSLQVK